MRKPNEIGSEFFKLQKLSLKDLSLQRMQTMASYQQNLETTVLRVILVYLNSRHLANYSRALNWICQTPDFCQWFRRILHIICASGWRGFRPVRSCHTAIFQQTFNMLQTHTHIYIYI